MFVSKWRVSGPDTGIPGMVQESLMDSMAFLEVCSYIEGLTCAVLREAGFQAPEFLPRAAHVLEADFL